MSLYHGKCRLACRYFVCYLCGICALANLVFLGVLFFNTIFKNTYFIK